MNMPGIAFFLLSIPFFADSGISCLAVAREMGRTVEITEEQEEDFVQQEDDASVIPSQRIVPQSIQQNTPIANLLTSNWKDGCYSVSNSLEKQLVPFFMIMAYLIFGGQAAMSQETVALGAVTTLYGASSLAGYFGFGRSPIAALTRINGISVLAAFMGLIHIMIGEGSMGVWLMTMLHIFDSLQGAASDPKREEDDYEILNTEQTNPGPLLSFFVESWRNGAINKANFSTCQTVQLIMIAVQMYLTLICGANGELSATMLLPLMGFILASIYSFFNPVQVRAIDACQSNGAMVGLMGASTINILSNGASVPFFMLYCLLAFDCMASFSSYFQEHAQRMEWAGAHDPLRVIHTPSKGGDGDDYSRL